MKYSINKDLCLKSIVSLLIVLTLSGINLTESTNMELMFREEKVTHIVQEGTTVDLICDPKVTGSPITIFKSGVIDDFVSKSELTTHAPDNFAFDIKNTAGVLIIEEITRDDEGEFHCRNPVSNYLGINVIYKPANLDPRCTMNYSPSDPPSDVPEEFVFNCTTDEGDPPVNMSLIIHDEDGTTDVTNNSQFVTWNDSKTLSYSSQVVSFVTSTIVCKVTQEIPSYENYQGSCSLGPLFSVLVSPQNYTITKEISVTITCSSSMSGVLLEWSDIPDEWTQSNVIMGSGSIEKTISYNGSKDDESVVIKCTGLYKGTNLSNSTVISFVLNAESSTIPAKKPELMIIFCIVGSITLLIVVAVILVYIFVEVRGKKAGKGHINPVDSEGQDYNVSVNNSNNYPETQEVNGTNDVDVDWLEVDSEMVDNPVYESHHERSSETGILHDNHGSEDAPVMIKNVLYESTDMHLPVTDNTQENPYEFI